MTNEICLFAKRAHQKLQYNYNMKIKLNLFKIFHNNKKRTHTEEKETFNNDEKKKRVYRTM